MSESEPVVTLTVTMSPEEYISIKKTADWDGTSVAKYLVECAMGRLKRGC